MVVGGAPEGVATVEEAGRHWPTIWSRTFNLMPIHIKDSTHIRWCSDRVRGLTRSVGSGSGGKSSSRVSGNSGGGRETLADCREQNMNDL